ncbi:rna-directed dna polymerase from mobile element jockey-like protein [Lasius niger]|uniref:Rna-directed dna polymerase from mobile element jockey-like protein n=1 Tax=Lasius niger TaxID=67767 RepID=A0A0J7K3E4_LASNI|nr:rna-directed dna polymerase from mobile element jockey-like protein [Lasius niger]
MANATRIVLWNANGLKQRLQELEVFLNLQKIDICLISETHFTKRAYLKIRGYECYHTPHPDDIAKGGAAILVRNTIKHQEEPKFATEWLQAATIKIHTGEHKYTVSAIYSPPKFNIKKDEYTIFLKSLDNYFIVGGDFNAKHNYFGSRLTNTKGRELYQAGTELKCNFASGGGYTYWPTDPNKLPDLIDFFITKGISDNYLQVENCYELSSDHSPVIMTLSKLIVKKSVQITLDNKSTNWGKVKTELEEVINLKVPLKTELQLDTEAESFVKIIQETVKKHTKYFEKRDISMNYPMEIREKVAEKRKARRIWQKTRNPADKTILNRLTHNLAATIREYKQESISKYLNELTADKVTNYSLWKAVRKIKRPIVQAPPLRKMDGTWGRTSEEKGIMFADHLESTFQPLLRQTDNENITPADSGEDCAIVFVTPKEVKKEIDTNINGKKAPGYDRITGKILKELPRKAVVKLTYLINAAFRLKYVPRQWKLAEVVMIPKPGKPPEEVASYRPISLLPSISKLFEKLLFE